MPFEKTRAIIFVALTVLCLWSGVTTSIALLMGLMFGMTLGCPSVLPVQRFTKYLLQASVVGLGFGIPIKQVLDTGKDGFMVAIGTISCALALGFVLAKLLKTPKNTSILISVGTAICGGSAIAAVAPVIRAKPEEMSVSLAAIFSLNAIALFLFPWIGHALSMSPEQFGLWSALAIHDTSSVVGAASLFGSQALAIATTVKLTRVVWIVPIAAVIALTERHKGQVSIPWFVLLFLIAATMRSLIPTAEPVFDGAFRVAKQALCVVLFWIGSGLNLESMTKVGFKPFIFAIILWVLLAGASLQIALW